MSAVAPHSWCSNVCALRFVKDIPLLNTKKNSSKEINDWHNFRYTAGFCQSSRVSYVCNIKIYKNAQLGNATLWLVKHSEIWCSSAPENLTWRLGFGYFCETLELWPLNSKIETQLYLPFAFWCCFPRKQMSVSSPGHECSGNSRTLCAIKMLRAAQARPRVG